MNVQYWRETVVGILSLGALLFLGQIQPLETESRTANEFERSPLSDYSSFGSITDGNVRRSIFPTTGMSPLISKIIPSQNSKATNDDFYREWEANDPAPIKPFTEATQEFDFKAFKQLRKEQSPKNIIFSPYGVRVALALIQHGASGQNLKQLDTNIGSESKRPNYQQLLRKLEHRSPDYTVEIANALWIATRFERHTFADKVKPEYLQYLKKNFLATARVEDFRNPATVDHINNWASEKTHGMIPQVIDELGQKELMVLLNAVYFQGKWDHKFLKNLTRPKDFELASGQKVKAETMYQSGFYHYFESKDFQLVELPYKTRSYSLYAFLPRKKSDSLEKFLNGLTGESWLKYRNSMKQRNGYVYLPKFTFDSDLPLNKTIQAMGITKAFDSNPFSEPNFPKIVAPDAIPERIQLYIGRIFQKAKIELEEEGTKAAAVTVITMAGAAGCGDMVGPRPPPPFEFRADHPFAFLLVHNETGTILFMGTVQDPRKLD